MTKRWDYWNGPDDIDRRVKYQKQFRPEFQGAGDDIQQRIASSEARFRGETEIVLPEGYASGWRPPAINDVTANAATLSAHLRAAAGDKRDTINGDFCWWQFRNLDVLAQLGLWMEHPVATVVRAWQVALEQKRDPTPWCHNQSLPPASHARCYWPDTKASSEWDAFLKIGGYAGMTYAAWKLLQTTAKTIPSSAD